MAIASLVVHAEPDDMDTVEGRLTEFPGVTPYGRPAPGSMVVVLEVPSADLEAVLDRLKQTPGAMAMAVAYVTVEDELEEA